MRNPWDLGIRFVTLYHPGIVVDHHFEPAVSVSHQLPLSLSSEICGGSKW